MKVFQFNLINIILLIQTERGHTMIGIYNELRLLGGSCSPQDNCFTLRSSNEDNLWNIRTCECGQHCILHNTCCIDSPYAGKYFVFPPVQEKCQKVLTTNVDVLMISGCSIETYDTYVQEMCTNANDDLKDPMSALPVTSMSTKTTYKNYFCAMCNNDADSISFWNIRIQGRSLGKQSQGSMDSQINLVDGLVFNATEDSWGVLSSIADQDSFHKVTLKFTLPIALKRVVKKCYSGTVSDCPPSQRNSILHHKCLAYYAPIKLKDGLTGDFVIFRNIHCGLCNNVTAINNEDPCSLEISLRRKAKPAMSFALLLDVNRNDGDLVGKVQRCKDDQVFDPFFKKCRSLTCVLPNYVLKNGSCVKS